MTASMHEMLWFIKHSVRCPAWLFLYSYLYTVCRFVFVLDGVLNVTVASAKAAEELHADQYAYIPADMQHTLTSDTGAGLLLFERRCVISGELRTASGCALRHHHAECCSMQSFIPSRAGFCEGRCLVNTLI